MVYSILSYAVPGRPLEPAGVLLYDEEAQRLDVKLRRDVPDFEADLELDGGGEHLVGLEGALKEIARADGAAAALDRFESNLSGVVRLSGRIAIASNSFDFTLRQLFREHVPTRIQQYVTHLPRYALRSAAGAFGDFMPNANDIEEWVEMPEGMRLDRNLFVCQVTGRSMEPLIESGSLCVFRRFGAGSRHLRKVLVEDRSEGELNGRYTVKVYHSTKVVTGEGWSQTAIQLKPLNREYPVLDLDGDPDRYNVIAEFVSVLEPDLE